MEEETKQLTKQERRALKKELKQGRRAKEKRNKSIGKIRNYGLIVGVVAFVFFGYKYFIQETPEEAVLSEELDETSLEGKIEEFEIQGADHIDPDETFSYNTNPPTSGSHWANAASWKFNDEELADEQLVHNLEHGGIWITYKDLDDKSIETLKSIANSNIGSVVITKREANEDPIVVTSWGKMMRLTEVDRALIQKFIDTNKNKSPERLAS